MKPLRLAALALFIVIFSTPGLATDLTQKFIEAQAIFETSLAGNKKNTESAIEKFSLLVEQKPAQPLYLAYLGAAYALKARDAWMPWVRLRNAEKGLDMIDKALLMLRPIHDEQRLHRSNVSTEARLVAVTTFLRVPAFMNRLQPAKDLLQETLDTPVFRASTPEVRGRLYLSAAGVAKREKRITAERDYLQRALAELPPSRFRTEAKQQRMRIKE